LQQRHTFAASRRLGSDKLSMTTREVRRSQWQPFGEHAAARPTNGGDAAYREVRPPNNPTHGDGAGSGGTVDKGNGRRGEGLQNEPNSIQAGVEIIFRKAKNEANCRVRQQVGAARADVAGGQLVALQDFHKTNWARFTGNGFVQGVWGSWRPV